MRQCAGRPRGAYHSVRKYRNVYTVVSFTERRSSCTIITVTLAAQPPTDQAHGSLSSSSHSRVRPGRSVSSSRKVRTASWSPRPSMNGVVSPTAGWTIVDGPAMGADMRGIEWIRGDKKRRKTGRRRNHPVGIFRHLHRGPVVSPKKNASQLALSLSTSPTTPPWNRTAHPQHHRRLQASLSRSTRTLWIRRRPSAA